MIYITLASIVYFVEINKRLQQVERQRILAEAMTTEAELRALRAQLNPHFLFNTLHSLMVLVKQNPDVAEEAIEQLSDMLRYTLRVSRIAAAEGTALCEELIMVEKYLALESLRLADRLIVVREIDQDALQYRVPALTLQPLVENAIRYGVSPRAKPTRIRLLAKINEDGLALSVSDDGNGTTMQHLERSVGLGLRSVTSRIELWTGGAGELTVETAPGMGFSVHIRIPSAEHGV
jgi:sensor histidine kinase YesM